MKKLAHRKILKLSNRTGLMFFLVYFLSILTFLQAQAQVLNCSPNGESEVCALEYSFPLGTTSETNVFLSSTQTLGNFALPLFDPTSGETDGGELNQVQAILSWAGSSEARVPPILLRPPIGGGFVRLNFGVAPSETLPRFDNFFVLTPSSFDPPCMPVVDDFRCQLTNSWDVKDRIIRTFSIEPFIKSPSRTNANILSAFSNYQPAGQVVGIFPGGIPAVTRFVNSPNSYEFSAVIKIVYSFTRPQIGTRTTISTVNGVLTDETEAALNFRELRLRLKNRFGGNLPTNIDMNFVYNPKSEFDFLEAISQKLAELEIEFFGNVRQFLISFGSSPLRIQGIVLEQIALDVQKRNSGVLASHLEKYRSNVLDQGNNLIIVPHSQGNFFANSAFAQFNSDERERTRIVGVATPTLRVSGGGRYVTDTNDRVINIVRDLSGAAPANNTNTREPEIVNFYTDKRGHSFINYYLPFGFRSEQKILDHIQSAIEELEQ